MFDVVTYYVSTNFDNKELAYLTRFHWCSTDLGSCLPVFTRLLTFVLF